MAPWHHERQHSDVVTRALPVAGPSLLALTRMLISTPNSNPGIQDPPPGHIEPHWGRWADGMAAGDFNRSHFRESSQWKALTREHAQIIDDDTFVLGRFFAHCPPEQQ